MKKATGTKMSNAAFDWERLIRTVSRRLSSNQRVRRSLPTWGRVHIDRQLPFLCVYRRPPGRDDPGTERLATSEASYLIFAGGRKLQPAMSELVRTIVGIVVRQFGACLVLELWTGAPAAATETVTLDALAPRFTIAPARGLANDIMTDEFVTALSRIKLGRRKARVKTAAASRCCPPRMPPILGSDVPVPDGCHVYGLEIAPVYRDHESGEVYPALLNQLRRGLSVALRRAFYQFTRKYTTHEPPHFHTLGRRAVVKAVWDADRLLADASASFDFLLQVTPVNSEQAWSEFRRDRFERRPTLHYRPLPADPIALKRKLYEAPVERVEDPALAQVLREKIVELDRQITMLQDRGTSRFLHESIQLYGGVEDTLLMEAEQLLKKVPARSRDEAASHQLTPDQFALRAREEIEYYRQQHAEMNARVEVRSDIPSLMVSQGNLLVSTQSFIPSTRVEAMLQHEVGTHVLTYHNGRAQRFRQLRTGLAGYDVLQEGLAVLTEYLVGGLSRPRMRLLAARVVAASRMIDGASFVEVFRELEGEHKLAQRIAFSVALRTFRSGGLTKDAIYLRGLCQILEYLGKGGELEPLFVGKIAAQHIPIVRELQWRRVLCDPPLYPRYMTNPRALARLERLRRGMTPLELLADSASRRGPCLPAEQTTLVE